MSDQTNDCEACFGTGNEPRMRLVQSGRKLLFQPCAACGGSGAIERRVAEGVSCQLR